MLLIYSDDILSVSHKPLEAIDVIRAVFKLKGDKAEVPEIFLGGGIVEVENTNSAKFWSMSLDNYVKSAVANIESKLSELGIRLP